MGTTAVIRAPGRRGHFTVLLAGHDRAVGRVTLDPDHRVPDRAEVSYEFLPAHGGRGLALEAIGAVLGWAALVVPGQLLVAVTQAANTRSRRLLENLGLAVTDRFVEYGQEQLLYTRARAELT
ncbi:GNAT family N-acetyltransferase [Kitasatospora sp. NPDC049258]|uniref:GNAT family N-acetyltransferase n=1 Tax=Kitasatospora sp. NPDC049258 TaxID=3155394 RepID=UPI00341AE19E